MFSINLNAVNLTELPTELHQLIVSKLPLKSILAFCQTSKKLKEVCDSDYFWQTMLMRDFAGQRPTEEDDSSVSAKDRYKNYSVLVKKNVALLKEKSAVESGAMGGFLVNGDLSGLRLGGIRFGSRTRLEVDLSEANLTNANLSNTKFDDVVMEKCRLMNANLSKAYWEKGNLRHADLSNANLTDARLHSIDFSDANLTNANLRGATLGIPNLLRANISGADLTDAYIDYKSERPGTKIAESLEDLKRLGAVWDEDNPPKGSLKYSK